MWYSRTSNPLSHINHNYMHSPSWHDNNTLKTARMLHNRGCFAGKAASSFWNNTLFVQQPKIIPIFGLTTPKLRPSFPFPMFLPLLRRACCSTLRITNMLHYHALLAGRCIQSPTILSSHLLCSTRLCNIWRQKQGRYFRKRSSTWTQTVC